MWKLAQQLAGERNRLIVTNAPGESHQTAEIVHEALIRRWPKLAGWINRDRDFLSWRGQIRQHLELWLDNESDNAPLLRGGMLTQASDWFDRRGDELSPEERRYVEASRALSEREHEKEQAAQQAKIAHERERAEDARKLAREQRRRAKIAVGGVVAALMLAAFGGWETHKARRAADLAERRASMAAADSDLSADQVASLNKMGDAELAQNNLAQALTVFLAAHEICHRQANEYPDNGALQHEHTMAHDRVGDAYRAQRNLPEALETYSKAFEIRDRQAKADPGNAEWERELSVSDDKIGSILEAQGNLEDALSRYRAGLKIREGLVKTRPDNVDWQHDLAESYGHLGIVMVKQQQHDEALAAFRQGRDIIFGLLQQSRDDTKLPNEFAWFVGQIVGR